MEQEPLGAVANREAAALKEAESSEKQRSSVRDEAEKSNDDASSKLCNVDKNATINKSGKLGNRRVRQYKGRKSMCSSKIPKSRNKQLK
ncbi:hypothetical protein Tcan_12097 [Toxocara canis]|uniref:Uncharacterized protein n=1 Tax=Toxocara canis TaxID=6265 RepID=A0A0B2UNI7_TOXCA|nr:hypothetical protein Tcan_12097 [Toxocara canis]